MANALLLPPIDAHGGCPQPRGSGDAMVPEWAGRDLVTLAMISLSALQTDIVYFGGETSAPVDKLCRQNAFRKFTNEL